MSAVALVEGGLEALQLLTTLLSSASQVSSAITTAQTNGTPLQLPAIQAQVAAAENAALAAVNSDPNTGS